MTFTQVLELQNQYHFLNGRKLIKKGLIYGVKRHDKKRTKKKFLKVSTV